MTRAVHKYTCERCGAVKVCRIYGCQKDCAKVCVRCVYGPKR